MIKLTERLAQNIVDKMMDVVPYNVNIMNEQGLIIGSGDKNRLGKLHEGAIKAIAENNLIAVYESKGGARPGVNMPIHFNDTIVGVIGISGNPSEVEPFASIVKVTAELLMNQEYVFNERRIKERIKEEFLYQWAYTNEYDEAFIERAASLNIDLSIDRIAMIIREAKYGLKIETLERFLHQGEYIMRLDAETILMFIKQDPKLYKRIENIYQAMQKDIKVGIGASSIMSKSLREALKSLSINEALQIDSKICYYTSVRFIDMLVENMDRESFQHITGKLEEAKGLELIKTLLTYIVFHGEVNTVSEFLHIHRNSLNYRLKKVEEVTGRNPRNLIELFELFTACALYKLK
jgi:carbohydrate diacid regulator